MGAVKMSEALGKILADLNYDWNDRGFGIDVWREHYTRGTILAFHGKEAEVIAWLKENGEW